jgi:hypothetical protein
MAEEESKEQQMMRAFGGMASHSEEYKQQVERLKRGTSSGISNVFGNAAELLPAEHLDDFMRGINGFQVGESLFADNVDPQSLRDVLEHMITSFHEDGLVMPSVDHEDQADGSEVVGMFFDGSQRKLLLADGTIQNAPEERIAKEVQSEAARAESNGEEAADHFRELAAAISAMQAETSIEESNLGYLEESSLEASDSSVPDGGEHADAKVAVSSASAYTYALDSIEPVDRAIGIAEPASPSESYQDEPDVSVSTKDGVWLWDIYKRDGRFFKAAFMDGVTIQQASDKLYAVVRTAEQGQLFPEVDLVQDLVLDELTGNIYYTNVSESHTVAYLNNGWRADRYEMSGGEVCCYVTGQVHSGVKTRVRIPVTNMRVDRKAGELEYETVDGSSSVKMRSRRLRE